MNICFLGLTGSGKTCYLYAASHVLMGGVNVDGARLSIMPTNEQQRIRLNRGIEEMTGDTPTGEALWPMGSDHTTTFPFEFMINGEEQFDFDIYDYRGHALDDLRDEAQDEREELYDSFTDTSCIVFLVDGYTLADAMGLEDTAQRARRSTRRKSRLKAKNEIQYLEMVVHKCHKIKPDVPVLLTITKRDIFSPDELSAGIEFLKGILPTLFFHSEGVARNGKLLVGITSVSLGRDLVDGEKNEVGQSRLEGNIMINVSQDLHIPILFALMMALDGSSIDRYAKQLFNQKVLLYRNGERVIFF